MIEKLTGKEKANDFSIDLRYRIKNNKPYTDDIPDRLHPLEPYVLVNEIIEPYSNHRAFKVEDKWLIPIATYANGCRTSYTLFDEVKKWSEIYSLDNVFVDVIANFQVINE